jgi:CRISPR/Cas system-associated protein Cas10 (large subunit of type III CRISPR-Cas system)
MGDIEFKEKLEEIVNRIENEVLDTLSDGGDDWFAASKVNDVLDIINEYI